MSRFFDAHLDLACMAVLGRDMLASLEEINREGGRVGPKPPAGVTLPALREGGVRFALATIFLEPVAENGGGVNESRLSAEQYPAGDGAFARRRARAQLEAYLTWQDRGLISLNLSEVLRGDAGVGEVRAGMGVAEVVPQDIAAQIAARRGSASLVAGLLIEGADCIAGPDELPEWIRRGLVAIGLTWARSSLYAAGNSVEPSDDFGLTPLGRCMIRAMDHHSVVHDLSHLSERSTRELLAATDRPVMASHSNCRALLDGAEHPLMWQRHLSDETIREIGRRGGVIGLNLYAKFLTPERRRPTIDDALRHVERICELMGHRRGVGLGSDMDGGFSALEMCEGIESPRDLARLVDGLRDRGWSDRDIEGFSWRNWAEFFRRALGHRP